MKIRTKFLAAVLATATAFSCALSASAFTNPQITLDNTTMPALLKGGTANATLTLKSSDFADVAGAKIVVKFSGVNLLDAKISGADWVKDTDYKVDLVNDEITLVDVFNIGDAAKNLSLNLEVKVSGIAMGETGCITVTGDFADGSAVQLYEAVNCGSGKIVVSREEVFGTGTEAINKINSIVNDENTEYFIPAGGVYSGNATDGYTFYEKGEDGKFYAKNDDGAPVALPDDAQIAVQTCKLPTGEKKVTTFGNSAKTAAKTSTPGYENLPAYEKFDGIQFGSYAISRAKNLTYGTLIIMGDYTAFKNYADPTATDNDFLNTIAGRYNATVTASSAIKRGDAVTFKYGTADTEGNKPYITVKMIDNTKQMWNGADAFQYAVRLYKLNDGNFYTGVAYSIETDANEYVFSAEIQTKVYNAREWGN